MKETRKVVGLVQAHHHNWAGAVDFSLSTVDGKLVVAEVIDRLKSMPWISAVVVAVPDDPANAIFRDIAAAHGAHCCFGARENVLERCAAALDMLGADIAVHVMGQHCFIDTKLLGEMLDFLHKTGANFVSLPDDFTPYFAGKIYRRPVLDAAAAAITALPDDRAVHFARFAGFIESHRSQFNAAIYDKVPQYDREFLLTVREAAREIFLDDRGRVDLNEATRVNTGVFESYQFACEQFGPGDHLLDIACGDGYGCRIMADRVGQVLGLDINAPVITANQAANTNTNISYVAADCLALTLPDDAVTGVTAMDLIEHLPLSQVDHFVKEVRRVVAPGGSFICSTPQNSHGDIPVVPCHVKEYSMAELRAILERHFTSVKILSSKSAGRLSEDYDSGQKMVALCC